ARWVDEESGRVVRELVTGGALHRPVRAQRLAGLEDLLHPDPLGAARAEPLEVLARIRESVGMIDAKAFHQPVCDELERLGMRCLEDLRILHAHTGELTDVEEA